jgi:MerR family transcriptional regulator/heat shock protein HspR
MRRKPDWYLISTAAELLDVHPQTLRKYERLGLVRPERTVGSMRVYTQEELDRVRLIKAFVEGAGINLAGVQRLLSIAEVLQRIRPLLPLAHESRGGRRGAQRRLAAEIGELFRILELD